MGLKTIVDTLETILLIVEHTEKYKIEKMINGFWFDIVNLVNLVSNMVIKPHNQF